jgi:CheY-like chemotaxis protein
MTLRGTTASGARAVTARGRFMPGRREDVLWKVRRPSERPRPREAAESVPEENNTPDVGVVLAIGDVAAGELVYGALGALSSRVVLVGSATLALEELAALRPALLVVDDELPLVRGLDLAGRIRAERSDVDVILLTADASVISLVGRLRVERIRCLQKPFDLERLRQAASLSLRALDEWRAGPSYEDLLGELEDQKSRFERRIKNLERRQASERPPPPESPPIAPPIAPPPTPATELEEDPPPDSELPDDLRVLVVDDDPLVRRAIARTFRKQQVTLAENGLAATRELERSRPDVIVSDLKMPEMDGLALAEEVKRRWPELTDRIVFVSGTGSQIRRAEEEAPSQPVLRKPLERGLLESRIAEVLQKALFSRKP